jgi:hypothetical protein
VSGYDRRADLFVAEAAFAFAFAFAGAGFLAAFVVLAPAFAVALRAEALVRCDARRGAVRRDPGPDLVVLPPELRGLERARPTTISEPIEGVNVDSSPLDHLTDSRAPATFVTTPSRGDSPTFFEGIST